MDPGAPRHHTLEPGERVVARWFAAVPSPSGRLVRSRGTLLLTDRRLLFDPRSTTLPPALLGPRRRAAIDAATHPMDLADIEGVVADAAHPAGVVVTGSRRRARFLVLPRRSSVAWHRRNRATRDEAVLMISTAAAGRRGGRA